MPWPIMNSVTVADGVVHRWGFVSGEAERKVIVIAARRTPGVTDVKDHRTGIQNSIERVNRPTAMCQPGAAT